MSGTKTKADYALEDLEALRAEHQKVQSQVKRAYKKWEKLSKKENEDKYLDVDWLISNPNTPGQSENLDKYMDLNYGGQYKGIHSSGYTHDGNYQNCEQNFELALTTYGKDCKDLFKGNVIKFLEDIFPKLKMVIEVESRYSGKFPKMSVKPIQYLSEESGLGYLFYKEDTDTWYKGTLVYGRWDVVKRFKNFDEAFEEAFEEANNYAH